MVSEQMRFTIQQYFSAMRHQLFLYSPAFFLFSLCIIIPLSLLFAYNYYIFNDVLWMAYGKVPNPERSYIEDHTDKFFDLLRPTRYSDNVIESTGMTLNIMMLLLFYPYRGLFFYSPVLLLAIMGLFYMYKEYKAET